MKKTATFRVVSIGDVFRAAQTFSHLCGDELCVQRQGPPECSVVEEFFEPADGRVPPPGIIGEHLYVVLPNGFQHRQHVLCLSRQRFLVQKMLACQGQFSAGDRRLVRGKGQAGQVEFAVGQQVV